MEGVRLESREVLSHAATPFVIDQYLLSHPAPAKARAFGDPPNLSKWAPRYHGPVYDTGNVATQTARGGQAVIVAMPDGSHFRVSIQIADNVYDGGLSAETSGNANLAIPAIPTQPVGTVRAYGMPGGKVGLIVDGTTANSQLEIDPLAFPQRKGYAHSFAYGSQGRSQILQIGAINVTSGQIGAIIGYKDADLSGPLTIGGSTTVDRIALDALLPGAAIGVGGTLNTLDVFKGIDLTSGPGITIGQDLNLLNVSNDITLANGANIKVGRFIGLTPQPPKGTATGSNILSLNQSQIGTGTAQLTPSVSAYVQGNINIGAGSAIISPGGIANSSIVGLGNQATPSIFLVNGSVNVLAANQLAIAGLIDANSLGQFTIGGVSVVNMLHRSGATVNNVPFSSISQNVPVT
jgi:hypothetical protein